MVWAWSVSEAFRVREMGLDGPAGMGLFPKLGEKPLEKQEKLGNAMSEREDGGSKVILPSLKMQVVPCSCCSLSYSQAGVGNLCYALQLICVELLPPEIS